MNETVLNWPSEARFVTQVTIETVLDWPSEARFINSIGTVQEQLPW